jgi:hypothetical protein
MSFGLNFVAQGTLALSATLLFAGFASAQCNTTCPVGGIPQNDACENVDGDPNAGCNVEPVAYQDIGGVGLGSPLNVCGTVGTWGAASRDLDWYRFSLAVPSVVRVTMVHTAGGTPGPGTPLPNATIFVINGDDCDTQIVEFAAASATCPFVATDVPLPAGNHVVIFTINDFAPNPPACPNSYVGTIEVVSLLPAACGTATNDCATVSGTGGCTDLTCCNDVCAVFGACCTVAWDQDCVDIAVDVCGLFIYECNEGVGAPANDCATDATLAAYDVAYPFDNTLANTDGPIDEPCDQTRDIWYLVQAEDDGELTINVTSPTFDSTIGIYAVGPSPVFDPSLLPQFFIGCVDILAAGGEVAVLIDAAQDDYYLVRIAGFAGEAGPGEVEFSFTRVIYNTGNTEAVNFDSTNSGNYVLTNLGWSSGNLNATNPQRWAAQALTVNSPGAGLIWSITAIHGYGFSPAGVQNDTLDFVIWERNGVANPNGEAQVASGSVPFPPPFDIIGGGANEDHEIDLSGNPFDLETGDYWLTIYADGATAPTPPANFAWFTNAQSGIPNLDPVTGTPRMWRSSIQPAPGFVVYTLPATTLQQQAGFDPNNVYNSGFRILGVKSDAPFDPCQEWDFDGNGCINGADLGVLLAAWGAPYGGAELGELLASWGTCPGGLPCP